MSNTYWCSCFITIISCVFLWKLPMPNVHPVCILWVFVIPPGEQPIKEWGLTLHSWKRLKGTLLAYCHKISIGFKWTNLKHNSVCIKYMYILAILVVSLFIHAEKKRSAICIVASLFLGCFPFSVGPPRNAGWIYK